MLLGVWQPSSARKENLRTSLDECGSALTEWGQPLLPGAKEWEGADLEAVGSRTMPARGSSSSRPGASHGPLRVTCTSGVSSSSRPGLARPYKAAEVEGSSAAWVGRNHNILQERPSRGTPPATVRPEPWQGASSRGELLPANPPGWARAEPFGRTQGPRKRGELTRPRVATGASPGERSATSTPPTAHAPISARL